MSGYSKRRLSASDVTKPAVHEWKKTSKRHGEHSSDNQHDGQERICNLNNIKISAVCSLSQIYNHDNPSMAPGFNWKQHGAVVERPAGANDYKMLSTVDEECICLDADAMSTSLHELNLDNTKRLKNLSTAERKGKSPNKFLSSDLTEGVGLSKTPKHFVSSLATKLQNPGISNKTFAEVDFVKNSQHADRVCLSQVQLSPCYKTVNALDEAQTTRSLRSLHKDTRKSLIQHKQNKLEDKTSITVHSKETRMEISNRNFKLQRKSSSLVSPKTVPSDNQLKHDKEENLGNKSSNKEFCCALNWSDKVYGSQVQCSRTFPAGTRKPGLGYMVETSPVSQLAPELTSCSAKGPEISTYTVQKGSTSAPQMKTQGQLGQPLKKRYKFIRSTEKPVWNKQETEAFILEQRSEEGRRKSKGEDKHSKGKQESIVSSVSELKILKTPEKSTANSHKKTQLAGIQQNIGKAKSRSGDSHIVCISSSESDSDVMEVAVSVPENMSKSLPIEVKRLSSTSKLENGKDGNNANVGKADPNKNIGNSDNMNLNPKTTRAVLSDSPRETLDVAQGHRTLSRLGPSETVDVAQGHRILTRLGPRETMDVAQGHRTLTRLGSRETMDVAQGDRTLTILGPRQTQDVAQGHRTLTILDCEKNSVQSKQSKLARNKRRSSKINHEQTATPTRGTTVHSNQGTGPELPKRNRQCISEVRNDIHRDCQKDYFSDKIVQEIQLKEKNTPFPDTFSSHKLKLLNKSRKAGCVQGNIISAACNEMFPKVLIKDSITSGRKAIHDQPPASLDINTEPYSPGHQQYQLDWTDQLSELITQFPLGIQGIHTGRASEGKETAVISQKYCSKHVIDKGGRPDNVEDLTKVFHDQYRNLQCTERSNNVLHWAAPSDDRSHDKMEAMTRNDKSSKEFCCILSYSAFLCRQQSRCLCTSESHMTKITAHNTNQYITAGNAESLPGFPKLNVNESNTSNKREGGTKGSAKYEDDSHKVQQNPLTTMEGKMFVTKQKKDTYVPTRKTITSSTRASGLGLQTRTESSEDFKDGCFSFGRVNVGCSSYEQDFNVPSQMSKELQPKHHKHKNHLPNDTTTPKKQKRSLDPEAKYTGATPTKSNSCLELEMTEQTKRTSEKCPSPIADKPESEISTQDSHIQEVRKNKLRKGYQNTKRSTKKSLIAADTRETFRDLERNTPSQLTLVNKSVQKTTSVVEQNGKNFTLPPAVQQSTKDAHQEKPKRQTRNRRRWILTGGMKTRSASRKTPHVQDESAPSDKMTAIVDSSLSALKNKTNRMDIEHHPRAPPTSDKEVKSANAFSRKRRHALNRVL